MSIPEELIDVLVSTPDTLHGAVRFKGTRVFAQSLFDYVLKGNSVAVFLDHFPDVKIQQAEAVLAWEAARIKKEFGFELST